MRGRSETRGELESGVIGRCRGAATQDGAEDGAGWSRAARANAAGAGVCGRDCPLAPIPSPALSYLASLSRLPPPPASSRHDCLLRPSCHPPPPDSPTNTSAPTTTQHFNTPSRRAGSTERKGTTVRTSPIITRFGTSRVPPPRRPSPLSYEPNGRRMCSWCTRSRGASSSPGSTCSVRGRDAQPC